MAVAKTMIKLHGYLISAKNIGDISIYAEQIYSMIMLDKKKLDISATRSSLSL